MESFLLVLAWVGLPVFLIIAGQIIFDPWHRPKGKGD
jgi:hypothetical protein